MPPPISGCIISRNDATQIERCIGSLATVAAEIIVVDTGSTDDTAVVARGAGARVESFPWCDDFSAARNHALSLAQHAWIIVLDTDEVLAPNQDQLILDLISRPEAYGYSCQIRNALPGGNEFLSQMTRLFRNDPRIRFAGRVHEHVDPALEKLGHPPEPCELTILHSGYGVDEATNRAKAERNIKGLLKDYHDDPKNRFVALKIGQLYTTLGEHGRALKFLRTGTLSSDPALAAEAYNGIAGVHLAKAEFEPALRACAQSISRVPYQRMAYVIVSQILQAMGRHRDAEAQLSIARSMTGRSHLRADVPVIGR
jgi:tetratricopeptide (TPR) repeat protein